eukprot:g18194.t1
MPSLYSFTGMKDINGAVFDFASLKGKLALLVNMKELQQQLSADLQIVCFPCNQFGSQESKPCTDILAFVQNTLADPGAAKPAGLQMMDKIIVNEAKGMVPCDLYAWLKKEAGLENIKWNFGTYFLVGRNGEYLDALSGTPRTFLPKFQEHGVAVADVAGAKKSAATPANAMKKGGGKKKDAAPAAAKKVPPMKQDVKKTAVKK